MRFLWSVFLQILLALHQRGQQFLLLAQLLNASSRSCQIDEHSSMLLPSCHTCDQYLFCSLSTEDLFDSFHLSLSSRCARCQQSAHLVQVRGAPTLWYSPLYFMLGTSASFLRPTCRPQATFGRLRNPFFFESSLSTMAARLWASPPLLFLLDFP